MTPDARVDFAAAVRVWWRIGCLGFGGPAGQIALMHRELVERLRWIGEARFLHALNYCMLLPGPEAQQLAIYIGWLLHARRGGIVAGTLFVLPGLALILALSALYAGYGSVPAVAAVFFGLKAAVLALVIDALLRVARRALRGRLAVAVAAAAFVAIWALHAPFPLVILGAATVGALAAWRGAPAPPTAKDVAGAAADDDCVVDRALAADTLPHVHPSTSRALLTAVVGLTVWFAPPLLIQLLLGADHVIAAQGWFFSEAALVTFGGAYAVLAYAAQRAVETHAWLSAGQMVDGLGLAETTPGPLILVLVFVAYVGAYQHPGVLAPHVAGLLAGVLCAWVTFAPCFLWIFLGAPYVERLRRQRVLSAALAAVTAAVVGVILNLSLWFALRTLFAHVDVVHAGPFALDVPDWRSVDVAALVLTVAALVALLRVKLALGWVLAGCALLGALWRLVG